MKYFLNREDDMFAVIYRGFVDPDNEKDYQHCWHIVADYFIKQCGAIGSCLHKTDEGYWLAYSRWPDKAARDAAWPSDDAPSSEKFPDKIATAIIKLKKYIDESRAFPEITMAIMDDLL